MHHLSCRGETQSLIQLLHACDDNTDLLIKKDQEYAQYIATAKSEERVAQRTQANQDILMEQSSNMFIQTAEHVRLVRSLHIVNVWTDVLKPLQYR